MTTETDQIKLVLALKYGSVKKAYERARKVIATDYKEVYWEFTNDELNVLARWEKE